MSRALTYILAGLVLAVTLTAVGWSVWEWNHPYPDPECTTACGMRVYGYSDCIAVDAAEAKMLEAMQANVEPWTSEKVCKAIRNAGLQVVPADGGYVEYTDGVKAAGRTFDALRVVQIASPDWKSNAYCHEIAHLLETQLDFRYPPVEHGDWGARGIWNAIAACHE